VILASIPSPSSGNLHLGPLTIHMYGVMLLLGIAAAISLTAIRWTRRGGDRDLVFQAAVWGVGFGVVGARAYHDVTSWNEVPHTWWGPFAVWQGGLGIWGGITFGVLAGAFVVRRAGASVTLMMDCVAPGLLLAQAIGRWGNYWNQELFGKPTSLPWGLEIDDNHLPLGYRSGTTFHPTFLYESLWDVAGVGVLLYVGRRFRIRPPALFALYVAWYTFGRTFEELLRVDPSHHFLGERINFWVSVIVFLAAAAAFVWLQFFRPLGPEPTTGASPPGPGGSMVVPRGRVRPRR
jgi:phosphatidylglycerol---prolipoprotein diacylglyceryl transferase